MEITYNREAAKYIIKDYIKDWVEFRDDGLYIKDDCIDHDWTTQGVFQWSPACELPEHDALTAPVLPIPFSANQLAAFFLTASGAFVASYYGSFEDGPDEGMLLAMGVRANQPREALKAAFAAYRAAQEVVGQLDESVGVAGVVVVGDHAHPRLHRHANSSIDHSSRQSSWGTSPSKRNGSHT